LVGWVRGRPKSNRYYPGGPELPPEQLRGFVKAAETAGLDDVWLWEDCFMEGGLTTMPGSWWTTKSLRVLAAELTRQGHRASAATVADLLHEMGFSLQGNAKTLERRQNPDRNQQFRYINEQARAHQQARDPVVSVDTKKKELAGAYKNDGREWRPPGDPAQVSTQDFADPERGKAIPYGIYDLAANTGWVNVGADHDTAAFAVESISRHDWHGEWNYALDPAPPQPAATGPATPAPHPPRGRARRGRRQALR
jgi:hypothetical protein